MHPNEDLIQRFYAAFNTRDVETAASYADDATFEDPAFGQLDAAESGRCGGCCSAAP